MAGRRVAARVGRRRLDAFMRLACLPGQAVTSAARPRRLAVGARVAVAAGAILIVLGLVTAAGVLLWPATGQEVAGPSPTAVASAEPAQSALTVRGAGSGGEAARSAPSGSVVVHVTGAVRRPGVVTLPAGSRVGQAVEAAGGASQEADTERVNLARPLQDGEQVYLPRRGEQSRPPVDDGVAGNRSGSAGTAAGGTDGSSGQAGTTGLVNINEADAAGLEQLTGIGPSLAQRIVAWRQEHGPFASVDSLMDVPGIGQAKLAALRQEATV